MNTEHSVTSEIRNLMLLPKTPENVRAFEGAIDQAMGAIAENRKSPGYLVQNDLLHHSVATATAIWHLRG